MKELIIRIATNVENLAEDLRKLSECLNDSGCSEKKQKSAEVQLSFEDVRKVLSAKSGAGFTAQVRELLERHGASKLSELKPEEYEAVVREAEEIGGK